jgi:putative iron-regulated protein
MIPSLARAGLLAAVLTCLPLGTSTAAAPSRPGVADHYADMALAKYQDALAGARQLATAIDGLAARPTDTTLAAARNAWTAARVPYMQTEVYRFGNPVVDAWEGRVNAWPLDEGLIDYVDASYGSDFDANAWYAANVIANPQLRVGGRQIDASMALLADLGALDEDLEGPDRLQHLHSARDLAARLSALGGGSLGPEKIAAILAALEAELAA